MSGGGVAVGGWAGGGFVCYTADWVSVSPKSVPPLVLLIQELFTESGLSALANLYRLTPFLVAHTTKVQKDRLCTSCTCR